VSPKVFNFALDTLYFSWSSQNRVAQFLTGMTEHETTHIQSIAVHDLIDEDMDQDYASEDNCLELFKLATGRMPAMKQFMIVFTLDDGWHEHGFPEGSGPVELFHEFTYEWHQYMHHHGYCYDDDYGYCECSELPGAVRSTEGFEVPKTGSIWGWRRTDEIPMNTPPFCGRL
jgi:hypothetical protein